MSINKDNDNTDRDKELQNKDRDQIEKQMDRDKDQNQAPTAERLQDKDHQMDKRVNDVELGDSYRRKLDQKNADEDSTIERRWNDIENDYRKRYPNITDEDVTYQSGDFDNMTGRIAKRTNRNLEEVTNEIRDWERSRQKG